MRLPSRRARGGAWRWPISERSAELNTWAVTETPFVFHVTTKVDAFVESTGPMTTLMNGMIHEGAGRAPEKARKRIKDWPPIMRGLGLY